MDCNGKLGLDVICAGVDARIAAGVHRYKRLKASPAGGPTCSLWRSRCSSGGLPAP